MSTLPLHTFSKRVCWVLLAAFVGVGPDFGQPAQAQNWPGFRGPNQTAISDRIGFPTVVNAAEAAWKTKLPAPGHGSPSVWGDRVFVMCGNSDNAARHLVCLDLRSGAIQWSREFPSAPYHLHKMNNHGTCTPAVDNERVYSYWASNQQTSLAAHTHDGVEVWRKNWGPFVSSHGAGTSPMVWRDLVIITHDHAEPNTAFVAAFDGRTGDIRWKIPRVGRANGTAYAVPLVIQGPSGEDELILASNSEGVVAVDPATGATLWQHPSSFEYRVVSSPGHGGGMLFVSCGQGGGGKKLVAISPGGTNNTPPARTVFEKTRATPYVTSPLFHKGLLYMVQDGIGLLTCMDAITGEELWQERVQGSFFSSPVCINDVLYLVDKAGDVITVHAGREYTPVGRGSLGELSYATPAVGAGFLVFRTENQIMGFAAAASLPDAKP